MWHHVYHDCMHTNMKPDYADYWLFLLVAAVAYIVTGCGAAPATANLGSCIVAIDGSTCVNLSNTSKDATLDTDSAKYVCRNLLEGLYFDQPCDSVDVVGTCTLPPRDGVQFEYVLYSRGWDAETGPLACEGSKGVWQ